MTTKYEAGTVVQGKVTGIKPFGAFVALDDETQGLVHISEVAHSYVKDINDFLSIGDEVSVKILKVEDGKISLSIRATEPAPERTERRPRPPRQQKPSSQGQQGFNTLEDKLKEWLKESNDRQAQLNKRLKK